MILRYLYYFFVIIPFLLFWLASGWLERDWKECVKTIKKMNSPL